MQRVTVVSLCDLEHDGEAQATETIDFSYQGGAFQLEACGRHGAQLRHDLAPFITAARKVRPHRSAYARRTAASRRRSQTIRAWAQAQGIEIPDRGRIAKTVLSQYEAAHAQADNGDWPARVDQQIPEQARGSRKRQPTTRESTSQAAVVVREPGIPDADKASDRSGSAAPADSRSPRHLSAADATQPIVVAADPAAAAKTRRPRKPRMNAPLRLKPSEA